MINIIVRAIIVSMGVGIAAFFSGMYGIGVFGAIFFVCTWLSIKRLHSIYMWIIIFCAIIAIVQMRFDVTVFVTVISCAYLFDVIRGYLIRSNNASRVWYLGTAFVLSGIGWSAMTIGTSVVKMISIHTYLGILCGTAILFFVCDYIMRRLERVNDLYAHGDLRCHT